MVIEDFEDVADVELTGDEAIIRKTKHGGGSVVGENTAREKDNRRGQSFSLYLNLFLRFIQRALPRIRGRVCNEVCLIR